ncbi:hypothetical protein, partial [Enterocloster clostridioformis]|uniref:hypothetical protein n=1 Tax=Enterocloster clostridioformis TaxID=1531 RepID=UPI001F272156
MSAPYNRNQSVALLSSLKTGVVHGKRKKNVGDEGWCVLICYFFHTSAFHQAGPYLHAAQIG